jgi:hypothetical protein
MAWGTSAWGGGGGGTGPWGACIPGGPDLTAPTVTLQNPASGAVDVANDTPIAFRISDDIGVDFSSIVVTLTVGSVVYVAFTNGQFAPAFNGPASFLSANTSNGFDFIIDSSIVWPADSGVSVAVTVGDSSCNLTTVSWTFQVSAGTIICCGPVETVPASFTGGWGNNSWGSSYWGGGLTIDTPVDGGGVPLFGSITPNSGFTTGGDAFTITGTNIASFFFNDTFSAGLISYLWSTMSGVTVEGPLGFNGTVQAETVGYDVYSGLIANFLKPNGDFHVTVDFNVLTPFLTTKPITEVTLAAIEAAIDNGNFIRFSYLMRGSLATTGVLRMEVWKSGILRHVNEQNSSTFSGNFGVMRYFDTETGDNKAAFWLNGNKIYDTYDCPASSMTIRFYNYNNQSNYDVKTQFDNFISHTVVSFTGPFGTDVATNVVEVTNERVRGTTPPTVDDWAGDVTIRVTNGSGSGCAATCYASVTPYVPATPSDWVVPIPTTAEEAMLRIQLTLLDHFDGTVSSLGVCGDVADLAADLAIHLGVSVSPTLDDESHKLAVHLEQPIGHPEVLATGSCFIYQFPPGYVVGRSQPFRPTQKEVSLTNDPVLRNPTANIGLGLRVQY